ncbi:MAG: Phage protein [uncultured Sulfurovum sp.]|uniref:Phage protein n=1 Tax=uncultured Sulfurovum sp. TaxID=269237 RepID=A0A6S6TW31_9BACT|nr:MAG: Phage protein [uncultured Sulfurovum sp.]
MLLTYTSIASSLSKIEILPKKSVSSFTLMITQYNRKIFSIKEIDLQEYEKREEQNYESELFHQKEEIHKEELKSLKKQIFISNLKAWIIGIILLAEIIFIVSYFKKSGIFGDVSTSLNKIAVIQYNKEVTEAYSTTVMEKMDEVLEDENFKSVLFIMGSPGGSPTASEELSEYLKEFQKEMNVTMYVDSIAASGGYYIASAVKPLIANKNAIVGSIGVIMPHYNLGELAKKVGVEEDFMAAGKFKKPISMFTKIDEENRKYMTENLLKPTYENFVQSVADNRDLKKEDILAVAEGKIFVANVPEIRGVLVDEVSSLYKVKKKIRESYKNEVDFVKINLDSKESFFPAVKVDLALDTALNNLKMQ